jgi:hypothetical protein
MSWILSRSAPLAEFQLAQVRLIKGSCRFVIYWSLERLEVEVCLRAHIVGEALERDAAVVYAPRIKTDDVIFRAKQSREGGRSGQKLIDARVARTT